MKRFKKDILNGNLFVQTLILFFPIFLGYMFQMLYNTFDAMIVGQYVGKEALAAVGGTTGTTSDFIINFIVSIAGGVSVVVAQNYGRKDYDLVSRSVRSGISLAIVLGFFMTIVGIIISPLIMSIMNVPKDVYGLAVSYIRIFFVGLIPSMIYNTGSCILRAAGDSKRPLYYLVISSIVNIGLDLLFVAVFNWGVNGAAIATVLSQCVSATLILITLKKTSECYNFSLSDFKLEGELVKKIVKIGIPAGIQSIIYSAANLYLNASINNFGTDAMAAYSAYGKLEFFYWNTVAAIGIAAVTVVGQNYGAGKYDRVKKAIGSILLIDLVITIVGATLFLFNAQSLISLFIDDVRVIEMGVEIAYAIVPFLFISIPIEILSSSFRACGDVFIPMIMSALGLCGVRTLYLLLVPHTSLVTVLRCTVVSWIIGTVIFGIYYFKGNWLKRKV